MLTTQITPTPLCSNCGKKPVLVKKAMLCSGCYWRQHRNGTTAYKRLPKGSTTLERFEFYTVRSEEPDGCWLWCGATISKKVGRDYGILWDGEGQVRAHRWSYEHFVKPIPDGFVIDHTCETPRCVRPDHLEPVTNPVNIQRGTRWPPNPDIPRTERVNPEANRPNCPKCGTPYTVYENGERRCKPCFNAGASERWMRTHGTGEGTGARQREVTVCPAGHEYTEENTYIHPKTGNRDCRTCRKRRSAEGRERARRREQAA